MIIKIIMIIVQSCEVQYIPQARCARIYVSIVQSQFVIALNPRNNLYNEAIYLYLPLYRGYLPGSTFVPRLFACIYPCTEAICLYLPLHRGYLPVSTFVPRLFTCIYLCTEAICLDLPLYRGYLPGSTFAPRLFTCIYLCTEAICLDLPVLS